MVRLVGVLERFAASAGAHVTVVFERPPVAPIASGVIEIGHAPRPGRDSGDAEIIRRVGSDPQPGTLRVVTSDRALADQVRAAGASVEAARAFRDRLDGLSPGTE